MSGGGSHPYGGGPGGGPPWPPPPYGSPPSGAYDPRHGQGGAKPPPAPHGGYVPQSSGVFDPRAQGPRQSSSAPYHRHPQSYGAPPSYPGAAFDPHGQSLGPGSYPGATPSHHGGSAPWGFPGGGAHQASSHGSWPQPPPSPGMEATLVGAPAPGTLRVGSAFGPYLLQAELGRGGMGVVYTAFHQKLNRKCALKTLLPHMVGPDGGERFVSEGRAAASLKKHPNVVQVFDAGVIDGTPYLAMEFVPGEPLDAMIKRRGQVPENELLEIGHKVALALDHAHQHHIVHRDMKPANVIIDEQGEPHILDFGLAANVEHGLQAEKGVVGTPGYMPPEQVDSKQGTIDNRTDVYSLGATLYAAASGRAPFQETTVTETLVKVLSLAPPRLHTLRPDLTADFCAVIERSMEKQQRHRYASALAFAGDLSLVLAGDPPLARPLSIAGRAVRRMQRHPLLVTMTGLLLLLLCAATIYGRIRQQEMETLWRSVTDQVASQTATEVRGLLEPALPLVRECEALAQAEFLPVRGDQIEFGRHLEKRFRFRELDWLSFGAADGKFTGVWRRPEDGAVLLNRSWPTPEGKVKLQEETIAEDGTREPVRTSEDHGYDPTTRDFYRLAEGSDAPAWTEPYDWWGAGGVGITLTLALRGPAGDMEGAFTADVRLASISAFLKGLSIGTSGRAFVLTRENKVTAGPGVKTVNDLPPELATAVAAIGAPLTELVQGVPISVEYNHQGEAFIAAFEVFTVDGGLEWISAVIMPANGFHQGGDRAARYVVWAGLGGVLAMLLLGGLLALFRRKRLRSRMRKRQTRAAFKAPRISR